jgi:RIO kinase 1
VPDTPGTLLAAKRYRPAERRMFHRDAGYTEGRRVRRSRETRAMARRTEFGRELLAGQWAAAEFAALSALWPIEAPVPYPVQLTGTELMLEFIGEVDGTAAPRLAQYRMSGGDAADLFEQCRTAMHILACAGYAHGDLSAFNLLVHRGRLVMIDLPADCRSRRKPARRDLPPSRLCECLSLVRRPWRCRRGRRSGTALR